MSHGVLLLLNLINEMSIISLKLLTAFAGGLDEERRYRT